MSKQEYLEALQEHEDWKKAKKRRKRWIKFFAACLGLFIGLLLTWAVLRVSPKDTWTLTKGVFASEEKIMDYVPKIEEVDNKLKKSMVKKPLNWLSKKHEEQVAKEILKGNLEAIVSGIRTYSLILLGIWLLVWIILYVIFYFLAYWIIGKFMWKEPKLMEKSLI